MFLHGNLASSVWWRRCFPFIKAGYEVYAPDLPGCGKTPETGKRHSYEYLSDFVHDFVTALELRRFYLVGHSMGGGIAQLFAVLYPYMVEKLVLVDSVSMSGFSLLYDLGQEKLRALMHEREKLERALKAVTPFLDDDEFFSTILEDATSASEQVFMEHPLVMKSANWRGLAERIDCPVLFLQGAEDNFIPPESTLKTVEAINECEMVFLKNCGHSPMVEIPERFCNVLFDFIENRGVFNEYS